MSYLKLPINFLSLAKEPKDSANKKGLCSLEESIAQNIMMQITCRYGEVAGRVDFGSQIWELEFNQLVKLHKWEEEVRKSLMDTIDKYEKRLSSVDIFISLSEVDTEVRTKGKSQIRRQAIISVNGKITRTGVPFNFNTTIFISPLTQ